ncbi:hypothetical protein K504DRAFT_505454 [Pleomassaria siparia CBS 279.74]|uniref:Uncharacterized protein n=1 Tax=Pleomassaria siparia CBS 279.74 TaxID=1314801 RepID=A0A6G1JYM8_9PLEO|nr:hypothetical protein K504DRAFT_505454 [Pleomassaria siparia CBS 279.74]
MYGKSVIECVDVIWCLSPDIRIVIVAGVVQAQCLYRDSVMYKALSAHGRIDLVALRVSDTKFTGSGTSDTGNWRAVVVHRGHVRFAVGMMYLLTANRPTPVSSPDTWRGLNRLSQKPLKLSLAGWRRSGTE